ncbi:hypothetical protein SK128_015797 [Halocaridina rubra]|uniref:Uncharacterized protein n=1 Tax=Halocaridina rubra TaxID=373956 RepID=A0AAN8WK54_HALRR
MLKYLVTLILLLSMFQTGYGINCFTGTNSPSSTLRCPGSCTKTVTGYDNEKGTAYGCSPLHVKDGCKMVEFIGYMENCFCNTDYCNSAYVNSLNLALVMMPLLVKIFI